jgi:hypothetical protein
MQSWTSRIRHAAEQHVQRETDPLLEKVAAATRGMQAISTVALLDLVGLPNTTGNARRVSRTMRSLGFVAIKSRRFMPGGWRDTVARGWARPVKHTADRNKSA